MCKTVIFDLDGTLLETVYDVMDSLNAMLSHYGYKLIDEKTARAIICTGAVDLIKNAINQPISMERVYECIDFFNNHYDKANSPKSFLFEGISELLIKLKKNGYKIAVLTNKPHVSTVKVYEKFLKEFDFDMYLGCGQNQNCKPHKSCATPIFDKLGVKPEDCYMVGDGDTDVLTAINCGMNCIAVLWGYRSKEQLANVGAKVFVNTPKELEKIFGV